jgi:hypothetical protein
MSSFLCCREGDGNAPQLWLDCCRIETIQHSISPIAVRYRDNSRARFFHLRMSKGTANLRSEFEWTGLARGSLGE